jgi:hypothetical protein
MIARNSAVGGGFFRAGMRAYHYSTQCRMLTAAFQR